MIRLFLGLVAFLTVSFGGFLYSLSDDASLDATAFENESLPLEETKEEMAPVETPELTNESTTPVVVPDDTPPAEKQPAESAPAPKPTELPASEKSESSGLSIQSRLLRFGFRVPPAPRSVDTIVLHSSYNALGGDVYSVDRTIEEYEQYGVGAHYLIDRSGTILRLVEEANIAYHAGSSKMPDGRKNVNDFSIGIEMIATEDSGYTDKQYSAVNALIADIETRHTVKHVVGHGDIAPGRKTDPWKFDWKRLK